MKMLEPGGQSDQSLWNAWRGVASDGGNNGVDPLNIWGGRVEG